MEEITSYRRQAMEMAANAISSEPWAMAIKRSIGTTPADLLRKYGPDAMPYCADNFASAAVKTPTIVRLNAVYGHEAVAHVLYASLTRILLSMQSSKTPPYTDADKREVCATIVTDIRLRTLPMGVLLAALWWVKSHHYAIYSTTATPTNVLEVLQREYKNFARMVASARDDAARAAHTAKQQQRAVGVMSWQDYARLRKIPYNTPQSWVAAQLRADSEPRSLMELQTDQSMATELCNYLGRTSAAEARSFVASALAEIAAQGAAVASKTDVMRLARRFAAVARQTAK